MADNVYGKYKDLDLERRDNGVLLITLNRPKQLNAMTYNMHSELANIWVDIDEDPKTKVAVITGAGRAFSAGND
ncbi:MAG: enoyl-CoA hydratase, partial [Alphaproteobacteria bacterium]|nr:enoyl-CoA hydratase [Alphaproteobacteria bacterium]